MATAGAYTVSFDLNTYLMAGQPIAVVDGNAVVEDNAWISGGQVTGTARMGGNGSLRTLLNHIVPNILPPMMVQISLNMGWAILNAAGLSFIGLGVRAPQAE